MKLFKVSKDGGKKSTVTGLFLIEWKQAFSIAFLKFDQGSRENFHSHAFNAITFWMPGSDVTEHHTDGTKIDWHFGFKLTPRNCFHKIYANKTSYAFTIRGRWVEEWKEYNKANNETIVMTNGRKIRNIIKGLV